jgi:methyl-accepting chemotaxis protein
VRALAQRTADAAKDIKVLINASAEQVAGGVSLVRGTGDLLGRIMGRVGAISEVISEIASSAELQAQNIHQVNNAVNDLDRTTQQNAAMVDETTNATRALSKEAEQLSVLVRTFRTGMAEAAPTRRPSAAPTPKPAVQSAPVVSGNLALASSGDWDDF